VKKGRGVDLENRVGSYLGTEIDGKWWKRYKEHHFFARGLGEWRFTDQGFSFQRALTRAPLIIPYHLVTTIGTGTWHAGQWLMGRTLVKVYWSQEGLSLCSGFFVSRLNEETQRFALELERRVRLGGGSAPFLPAGPLRGSGRP
jgi:hypothetical protein